MDTDDKGKEVKSLYQNTKISLRADREFWDGTVRELVVYGGQRATTAVDIADHLLTERRKRFPGLDEEPKQEERTG